MRVFYRLPYFERHRANCVLEEPTLRRGARRTLRRGQLVETREVVVGS